MLAQRDLHTGNEPLLGCLYYDAGLCRSCVLIKTPQDVQLADKQARAKELIDAEQWREPSASGREAFRNKVKLAVTGTVSSPNLGIIRADGEGQDLRECPLPTPGIQEATARLAQFVSECGFVPYDPRTDHGVLKFVIVTESAAGELMVRFVAKRRGVQGMLFKKLERLRELVPAARVVSLNVQPERMAIIEGEEEILISDADVLPMNLHVAGRELVLNLRPQSFFQTNTEAAQVLYSRAVEWLGDAGTAWDLYSGVGGFALALASCGVHVVGVETQEQAVAAARKSAEEMLNAEKMGNAEDLGNAGETRAAGDTSGRAEFVAADATRWAREQGVVPDAIVVNPPRRGIGPELAEWIEGSGVRRVLYSSCNADTLAQDLAVMRSYRVKVSQVVDMFPHTRHFEVVALLELAS